MMGCGVLFSGTIRGDCSTKNDTQAGRGGGQVVSVLAFSSEDPSSNPADVYSFFPVKSLFEKNENITKRGRGWPI